MNIYDYSKIKKQYLTSKLSGMCGQEQGVFALKEACRPSFAGALGGAL